MTVGLGLLVLFGTFGLAPKLETNFLDDSGQDTLTVSQELPAGTGLAATDAAAKQVEKVLAAHRRASRRTRSPPAAATTRGRAAAATHVASWSLALTGDTDAEQMQRDPARRSSTSSAPRLGEITFGGGQAARTSQLEVVVQAADPEVLTPAAEAGADGDGRRCRTSRTSRPAWPSGCRAST